MKFTIKLIVLAMVIAVGAAIWWFGINKPPEATDGFLEGKVTIGPLCPVERIPPDPNCQPTEATYKAWQIAVYTLDKKTKLAQIEPNIGGSYQVGLPAGEYFVDFEQVHTFGKSLPTTVTITKDETTVLNIDIDTGIR